MNFIDGLGLAAGICTSSSVIPQLVTTIKKKRASDVSIFMFIVLFIGNGLWVYYGIDKEDVPIISTNIFSLLLNMVMLYLKVHFGKNSKKEKDDG